MTGAHGGVFCAANSTNPGSRPSVSGELIAPSGVARIRDPGHASQGNSTRQVSTHARARHRHDDIGSVPLADAQRGGVWREAYGRGLRSDHDRDPASPRFFYAEDYHQQYLAKNPGGYCGLGGTGVSCPVGVGVDSTG